MKNKLIITLCVLLFLCVSYVTYDKYNESQTIKMQEAATYGYNYALEEINSKIVDCTIPIIVSNKTVDIVSLECLQNE